MKRVISIISRGETTMLKPQTMTTRTAGMHIRPGSSY